MSEAATVTPGWYPDGHGSLRYFDGSAWTEYTQPLQQQAPAAAAPMAGGAVAGAAGATAVAGLDEDAEDGESEPLYRQGWFIVDMAFLAGMALVLIAAAIQSTL